MYIRIEPVLHPGDAAADANPDAPLPDGGSGTACETAPNLTVPAKAAGGTVVTGTTVGSVDNVTGSWDSGDENSGESEEY